MKKVIAAIAVILAFAGCSPKGEVSVEPMRVIFETDIGNDVDDALALDMLYKYMDAGQIELLAIMINKASGYSAEFIDIMNTWYGYPDIPIGDIKQGVIIDDYVDYAENVVRLKGEDGTHLFRRSLSGYDGLPLATDLYRKILAQEKDNSVTLISVGFSTNLARLLDSEADEYSPLTGRELVARKVKLLSVMGGSFGPTARAEFNIENDIPAAAKVFAEWPGEIVLSPFELGSMVRFPASVIENDFKWGTSHPMVEAYLHYRPMPYDRQTWDLTSVLYAVDPENSHMNISQPGTVVVNDEGYTSFTPDTDGYHRVLSVDSEHTGLVRQYFIDLITARPKNRPVDTAE